MNAVRVGIAGFGRIGAEHAAWIAPSAKIVAVADVTEARRDLARQRGFSVRESFQSLISDPNIDAVLISTPTSFHHEQAIQALRAGKHVMVEKPLAMNLPQAKEIIEAAREAKRILSVFHNRRWDADFLAVKSAIASGIFGKIINIESRLGQWASCVGPAAKEYRPNWRNEAVFGGGGLLDWGSHFLDQIWQLMLPARPQRIFAQLRGNVWTRDTDDFARVTIDFDNGAVALIEINTTTTSPLPRWHIDGTLGSATAPHSPNFDTKKWAELTFLPSSGNPGEHPLSFSAGFGTTGGGSPHRLPSPSPGLTEPQIWQQFFNAIAGTGEPAVTPESVLPTMSLLDAAVQSSKAGRAIQLQR
jgi:predicted dehydrogenase